MEKCAFLAINLVVGDKMHFKINKEEFDLYSLYYEKSCIIIYLKLNN